MIERNTSQLNGSPAKWKCFILAALAENAQVSEEFILGGQQAIPAFNLCVQGDGNWKVRYHIADYAEKIKMAAV